LLKKLRRWTGIVLLNLVLTAVLLELTVGTFLRFPSTIRFVPAGLAGTIRQVYAAAVRNVVQLNPDQSVVDPELLYRLRPGRFTFSNVEFSTPFEVNSLGVRDTEDALRSPEIVVLGDSLAMGWGVRQEEAFPQVLERLTGVRVLNGGVSSYGTARELTLLKRVDTSRMRILIIQYHENDLPENRAFVQNNYRLTSGGLEAFERLRDHDASRTRYFPFRYALGFIDAAGRSLIRRTQSVPPPATHADLFLEVLGKEKGLDSVQLIVFELGERGRDTGAFAAALRTRIGQADRAAFIKNLKVLDLSSALTATMFYDLDDHLRAEGHRAIATSLQQVLTSVAH
jgi:hypothetical protein